MKWNVVKKYCAEMGQIKSKYDWLYFSLMGQGGPKECPALRFHFIARQLTFIYPEYYRVLYHIRKIKRKIKDIKAGKYDQFNNRDLNKVHEWNYADIAVKELKIILDQERINLVDQKRKIEDATRLLDKLLETNGGKQFTNEQVQSEWPHFYKWLIANNIKNEFIARKLGIEKGTVQAHETMCSPNDLLPEEFKPIDNMLGPWDCGHIQINWTDVMLNSDRKEDMEGYLKALEEYKQKMIEDKKELPKVNGC